MIIITSKVIRKFAKPDELKNSKEIIKERLKDLRLDYGLKQRELAELLNIDRSTYSYYETGKTEPKIADLIVLSELYNVSIDFLVNGKRSK